MVGMVSSNKPDTFRDPMSASKDWYELGRYFPDFSDFLGKKKILLEKRDSKFQISQAGRAINQSTTDCILLGKSIIASVFSPDHFKLLFSISQSTRVHNFRG